MPALLQAVLLSCLVSTRSMTTIAVAQLRSSNDKLANLVTMAQLAVKARKAKMLFLPENCGYMGNEALENAENIDDNDHDEMYKVLDKVLTSGDSNAEACIHDTSTPVSLIKGLQYIAKSTNLWISAGGIHVKANSSSKLFNTHYIFDNTGKTRAIYRKIHLFDVSIPDKVTLKESDKTLAGKEIMVCKDTPIGTLGLSTCYDVRFPELYTELVANRGAQVLLVPSAFTVPTGKAHWHVLLRARAIENQCFVIAAAQFGKHNEKRDSYGHSLVVSPWGEVRADAGGYSSSSEEDIVDTPGLIFCDIDLDQVESVRTNMPIQQHRQNAEYE